jgi:VIT1/CCC1 family predicted Fe2+/Mn2+ transporter
MSGTAALVASLAASLFALALLGLGISRLTRRSALFSAVRQVVLGGVAAGITYLVGKAVGGTIS